MNRTWQSRLRRLAWGGLPFFLGYVTFRGAQRSNDFKYPYNVARHVWKTGEFAVEAQPRYPVTFHALLSPIASLPIGWAAAIWAILSIAAVLALPGKLARLTGIEPVRQRLSWLLVLPAFVDALVLGQGDPINIFLVSAGLAAVKEGKALVGTGLVGFAGLIKILPILYWTTIVSRCRARAVWAGMLLTLSLALSLVIGAAGWSGGRTAILEQWEWIQDHEKPWHLVARHTDLRANNESLPIVLARTFGEIGMPRPSHCVSVARWPLDTVWMAWFGILALMIVVWCASIRPASRLTPGRGWLAMFALTASLMLASTPICWHHYFLWNLPAALYLADRRRLLIALVGVSLLGTLSQTARGVGCHMALTLFLFAVVAYDVRRSSRTVGASPSDA
ncbi:glycosyltransferase family 87 protein [Singulisphaera rosea]